ncbi:baseplate J/gp47 family protein [Pseudobacteroides cellulosolvens]|uniref:Uncharacterized protein n=1 Tax=Pseudobacteroides cellulosolvens ATCC 35603 = DSM 2933 TaxID=398512 RepID=A0A0L6JHX9_9FIRM|nr:baseplate J/gp47 family protein [Pseudobacteroides cellulosolvens]KNY25329.1 hypothetical protein Bccel_0589 [Pseudobacteroides cellulosolvens ATCC 35603 = DSM 2933]
MLTLKELNDRTYQEILNQSKELIPRVFPQWTDLRAHDPGITLVELFAWLTERLEDNLNKVTYKNYLKFLKMLNIRPREPERASTTVTFEGVWDNVVIPRGTRICGEGVVFETDEAVCFKNIEDIQDVKGNKDIRENEDIEGAQADKATQTVKVTHGKTLSCVYYFSCTGEDDCVELDGYLPFYGVCEVKVRCGDYWNLWKERLCNDFDDGLEFYQIERNDLNKKTIIKFGKDLRECVDQSSPNIMVIAYEKDFEENRYVELKRALPNQVLRLDWAMDEEIIHPGSFKIQVGEWLYEENDYRWKDYERVDDFLNSRGNDPHYLLDYQNRELHFGNNENGTTPKGHLGNRLKIISCTLGCGAKGNIRENILNEVIEDLGDKVKIIKQSTASSGFDGESLNETVKNLLLDMKKQYRAVTAKDYEDAVLSTPGIKVARAKALPEFAKGQKNYPYSRTPGQLTIVAAPYSTEKTPMPDDAFLDRIRQHIDSMRLVTTEVHVMHPAYIGVKVRCSVVVMPHIRFDERAVLEMLEEYISPMGGKNFPGWAFGETVRKGDVISKISTIDGVEYIKDIQIYADGNDVKFDKSGDLLIPPYALVYSQKHEVVLLRDE